MASTPEDPSDSPDDERTKLELPRVGGLFSRKKKPQAQAIDPDLADDTRVEQASEPDGTQPVTVLADDQTDEPAEHDRGPDLVAPKTAYEADAEEPTSTRTRRLPSLPSFPTLPELTLPLLDTRLAAAITGAVVGLTGVLLIYLFQLGCGAVRGAGSCGSAGLFLLIAVLVAMVFEGAALLKAWYFDEPLTTSFLAVALVSVTSMLFLLPVIDRWFMVLVIPVLSAAYFWLSWWVTSRFDAPQREAERERENAR